MTSIAFPQIFSGTHTNIYENHEATVSNLMLILQSARGELFGDPDFGSNIKKLTFNQNDSVLMDLITEDIYTTIKVFIPQLYINRNDIILFSKDNTLYVSIKGTNLIDYQTDMYTLALLDIEDK